MKKLNNDFIALVKDLKLLANKNNIDTNDLRDILDIHHLNMDLSIDLNLGINNMDIKDYIEVQKEMALEDDGWRIESQFARVERTLEKYL